MRGYIGGRGGEGKGNGCANVCLLDVGRGVVGAGKGRGGERRGGSVCIECWIEGIKNKVRN